MKEYSKTWAQSCLAGRPISSSVVETLNTSGIMDIIYSNRDYVLLNGGHVILNPKSFSIL